MSCTGRSSSSSWKTKARGICDLNQLGTDMREWCSCGAAVRATPRRVIAWRAQHHCPDRPTPDEGAHIGTGAQVEHAGTRWYDGESPIVTAGFRPNPPVQSWT